MQKREKQNLERETGFEPATLALARRCSTTELFPLSGAGGPILLRGQNRVKPITGAVLGQFRFNRPRIDLKILFISSTSDWAAWSTST